MSLQVWLPLNGDLQNKGLDGDLIFTTLGTVSWVDGKICPLAMKAGKQTQTSNGVSINNNFIDLLNGNYSISVWIKPYGQHVHYNGSIFSSGNWNTANKRWAFGVSQDNSKVDVLCMNYNTYINCTVPENEWTNIICTRAEDDIVKLYKNGEYIGSRDCSSDPNFNSDANNACIGRETYANGYFSFNGAIQDFRLYDHALSLKQIKEIAKGLILHYPLDNNGLGLINPNLEPHSHFSESNWWTGNSSQAIFLDSNKIKIEAAGQVYQKYSSLPSVGVPSGTTLTLSCYFYENTISTGNRRIYYCSNPSWKYVTVPANFTGLFTSTFTTTAEITKLTVDYDNRNMTGGRWVCGPVKLEEGTQATPWCPNENDQLYATLGYNDNIIYDTSGYQNNKTPTNLSYSIDTIKYQACANFDGNTSVIPLGNISSLLQNQFTVNLWFKKSELGSKNYETLFGGPSGFEMDTRAGSSSTLSLYMASTRGGNVFSPFNFNQWYMVTMVNDGTNELYYINGELKKTITKKAMPNGNYFIGSWSSVTSQNYKGLISDFRIYATALLEADILELYYTSTMIDKNQNVYTREIRE